MRHSATLILIGCLAAIAVADPLTEIPARWSDQLVPIPAQRLDELEVAYADRIRETRQRLNDVLRGSEATAGQLAATYGRLGALYAAHRLFAGAELALGNAWALDPQGFQWAYYGAHIALEQGEAARALEWLAAAAAIDPTYAPLALRRGDALLSLNDLAEARAAYREIADEPGLEAAARYGLAQIDLLERDWPAATAKLTEVLALQPEADAVHYPLGQALLRSGQRDAARRHLAQRGAIKPSYADPLIDELQSLQAGARYQFERGTAAVKRRDYAVAAEAFAAGLAEEPGNVRARTSYARALWLAGRPAESQRQLQQAIADGPAETLPRFLLAVVQDDAGDVEAAVAGYSAVLGEAPGHAGALSYLAGLRLRQGAYGAAAARFEQAIAAGVTQLPLFLQYWGSLLHAGIDERVLHDRAVSFDKRFPEPPVFRYLLAKLLVTAADPAVREVGRGLAVAQKLYAAQPIPLHGELLALALAANGDFALAVEIQDRQVGMAQAGGAWVQATGMAKLVEDYRAGRLPADVWPADDPMFMPPPPNADLVMQNYPAGQPY